MTVEVPTGPPLLTAELAAALARLIRSLRVDERDGEQHVQPHTDAA